MSKLLPAIAATALVAAVAASPASAWTSPTTLSTADEANPLAQAAFDGSVMLGWLDPTASLSKRLGPPAPITTADPFEKVWDGGLDRDGNAIVVTVRRHKPVQRIRAIIGGTRRTISDNTHSATQPTLDVAPDGTAVAGWAWHDPAGWRAQVAIRRPGQARFDKPQTVSPPAAGRQRPFVRVAAGEGGRAVLTWQVQTGGDAPLHVLTAGENSIFGADQVLAGGGRWADVALAVGADGAVSVAYLGQSTGPTSLRVASGTAGAPLSEPAVLATGGKGTSSGLEVATAFSADGTATVAWGKPGSSYEDGGTLEVFTGAGRHVVRRAADARSEGPRDRPRGRPRFLRRAGLDDRRSARDVRPLDGVLRHAAAGRRRVRLRPGDLRSRHRRAVAVDRGHAQGRGDRGLGDQRQRRGSGRPAAAVETIGEFALVVAAICLTPGSVPSLPVPSVPATPGLK